MYGRYITTMQNLTAGALLPECLEAYPATPHYCFMAPHMSRFIKTPLFMFNSKVDAWQAGPAHARTPAPHARTPARTTRPPQHPQL